MTAPILTAEGLSKQFGAVTALCDLNLAICPGEIYGLVGPDGAGKTTALRLMTGVLGPTSGHVWVVGHPPLGDRSEVRDALGYMPQQYSLYGDLSVGENLEFFAAMFSLPRDLYQERKRNLLAMTRLARFEDRRVDALSGGMYKKLALACALLHRPRLLVLDEPTNGVDPVSRREFWELLRDFSEAQMAIVLSTPYMDEAARCHRVGLMHQGRLLLEGAPPALLRTFRHEVCWVDGGDRHTLSQFLAQESRVLAMSPAGARLRAVVAREGVADLQRELATRGAQLVTTAPDFEDLFISCLRQSELEENRGRSLARGELAPSHSAVPGPQGA